MKVSKRDIPNTPRICPLECVYATDEGICTTPRTNKGNSDATCHWASNKLVVEMLVPINEKEQP